MDVRVKFPVRRPFRLSDHWPIQVGGSKVTFEGGRDGITSLVITFEDQPLELAASLTPTNDGGAKAEINIPGNLQATARRTAQRFLDYATLYFVMDIDLDEPEIEYVPKNEEERVAVKVFSFKSYRSRPTTHLPFSLLSQAFIAGEGIDDPSFPAKLLNLSREALLNDQYIESFRYSFLLFEALYGEGKFHKAALTKAFSRNKDFIAAIQGARRTVANERPYIASPMNEYANGFSSASAFIDHLVDRRGFFFHANLARANPWHPAKQSEASPLADFCVLIANQLTRSFSREMFSKNVETRLWKNAELFEAIMSIKIDVEFIDRNNIKRTQTINVRAPGTKPTNQLAVYAHKNFLNWAEIELADSTLLSAIAIDQATGIELFRSGYFSPSSQPAPPS